MGFGKQHRCVSNINSPQVFPAMTTKVYCSPLLSHLSSGVLKKPSTGSKPSTRPEHDIHSFLWAGYDCCQLDQSSSDNPHEKGPINILSWGRRNHSGATIPALNGIMWLLEGEDSRHTTLRFITDAWEVFWCCCTLSHECSYNTLAQPGWIAPWVCHVPLCLEWIEEIGYPGQVIQLVTRAQEHSKLMTGWQKWCSDLLKEDKKHRYTKYRSRSNPSKVFAQL